MSRLDLAAYLEDDAVGIPGIPSTAYPDGKTYRFASPSAKVGLSLAALANLAVRAQFGGDVSAQSLDLDDDQERDLMRDVMGDTLDELTTDGVSWVRIQRLNKYLFIHFAMGEDAAARMTLPGESSAPVSGATRQQIPARPATVKGSNGGSTTRRKPKPSKAS